MVVGLNACAAEAGYLSLRPVEQSAVGRKGPGAMAGGGGYCQLHDV